MYLFVMDTFMYDKNIIYLQVRVSEYNNNTRNGNENYISIIKVRRRSVSRCNLVTSSIMSSITEGLKKN